MGIVRHLLGDLVGCHDERGRDRVDGELSGVGCQRQILELGSRFAYFIQSHIGQSLELGRVQCDAFGQRGRWEAAIARLFDLSGNGVEDVVALLGAGFALHIGLRRFGIQRYCLHLMAADFAHEVEAQAVRRQRLAAHVLNFHDADAHRPGGFRREGRGGRRGGWGCRRLGWSRFRSGLRVARRRAAHHGGHIRNPATGRHFKQRRFQIGVR